MKRVLSLVLTIALLLLAGLLGITVSAETHTDISGDGVGHAFDNACDTTCNDCGYVRVVGEHEYDNACDATCNLCGATRTPEEHVYDDNDDHYCNICNLYTLLQYEINYRNHTAAITGFDGIDSGAFVIPENINGYPVVIIKNCAFFGCNLTSITIPNSITRMEGGAFLGCTNLKEVHISDM